MFDLSDEDFDKAYGQVQAQNAPQDQKVAAPAAAPSSDDDFDKAYKTVQSKDPRDLINYHVDQFNADPNNKIKVDPDFAYRIADQESEHFHPDVLSGKRLSPKGAIGMFQLMPGTAKRLNVNPYDPIENARGGVNELGRLLNQYQGDQRLAAAGYNAGEGAVSKYGGAVPNYQETKDYVAKTAADDDFDKAYQQLKSVPDDDFDKAYEQVKQGGTMVGAPGRPVTASALPPTAPAPAGPHFQAQNPINPMAAVNRLQHGTAAQIQRGLQNPPQVDPAYTAALTKAAADRDAMMKEYNEKNQQLMDLGPNVDPQLKQDIQYLRAQINMSPAQMVAQQQQFEQLGKDRALALSTAIDRVKNDPKHKEQAIIELGRYGPVSPGEAAQLGITQHLFNNLMMSAMKKVTEFGGATGRGLKHIPMIPGVTGMPGTEEQSNAAAFESTMQGASKQLASQRNVYGSDYTPGGVPVGQVVSGVGEMLPDLGLAAATGGESLWAQAAKFGLITGASAFGRGEDPEGVIKATAFGAGGVLTGHAIGMIAPEFAESVLGQMGVRGTGNAILGGLWTAADGGDTKAIASSAILFGAQGLFGGGHPEKAADLLRSSDLQEAVIEHAKNPSAETFDNVAKTAEKAGLDAYEAQKFATNVDSLKSSNGDPVQAAVDQHVADGKSADAIRKAGHEANLPPEQIQGLIDKANQARESASVAKPEATPVAQESTTTPISSSTGLARDSSARAEVVSPEEAENIDHRRSVRLSLDQLAGRPISAEDAAWQQEFHRQQNRADIDRARANRSPEENRLNDINDKINAGEPVTNQEKEDHRQWLEDRRQNVEARQAEARANQSPYQRATHEAADQLEAEIERRGYDLDNDPHDHFSQMTRVLVGAIKRGGTMADFPDFLAEVQRGLDEHFPDKTKQVGPGQRQIGPAQSPKPTEETNATNQVQQQGSVQAEPARNDQERLSKTPESGRIVPEPTGRTKEGPKSASVKAFITKADEAALKSRGYSDDDIYKMKPADAQKILESPETKPITQTAEPTKPDVPIARDTKPKWGASNKIIRIDEAEELRRQIRDEWENTRGSGGPSTEQMIRLAKLATFHVEAGARAFRDFSKRMIEDVGERVEPHLRDLYDKAIFQLPSKGGVNVEDRSILGAVRGRGGIRNDINDKGELKQFTNREAKTSGLVGPNGKLSVDDMASALNDDGFRDTNGQELTPDTLVEMMDREQRGASVHSMSRDQSAIDADLEKQYAEHEAKGQLDEQAKTDPNILAREYSFDDSPLSKAADRIINADDSETDAAAQNFRDVAKYHGLSDEAAQAEIQRLNSTREDYSPSEGDKGVGDEGNAQPSKSDADFDRITRADKIDENRHWNFSKSTFSSPESESAFRKVVREAAANIDESNKVKRTFKDVEADAANIDPSLAAEVAKSYKKGDPIPSDAVVKAATDYAQRTVRQATDILKRIEDGRSENGDPMSERERFDMDNQAAALLHDAREVTAGKLLIRSDKGRSLAFEAMLKTDAEQAVDRARNYARRNGTDLMDRQWITQEKHITDMALKLQDKVARENELLDMISKANKGKAAPKENWQTKFATKMDQYEQEARSRIQRRLTGNDLNDGISGLLGTLADYAIIYASKIAKGIKTLADIRKDMDDEFGHDSIFTDNREKIEREAVRIHEDQKLDSLVEAAKLPNKESRVSALAELKKEIATKDKAAKDETAKAEKAKKDALAEDAKSKLKQAKVDEAKRQSDIAIEARKKLKDAKDTQTQAEFNENRAIRQESFEKVEAARKEANRAGAAETDANKARLEAQKFNAESRVQAQKAQDALDAKKVADEARQKLKEARRDASEAQKVENKYIRYQRQEAIKDKARSDYEKSPIGQLQVQGRAALIQMQDADFASSKDAVDALAKIGAAKLTDPTMSSTRWTQEMRAFGDPFIKNQQVIRDAAGKQWNDARTEAKSQQQNKVAAEGQQAALTDEQLADAVKQYNDAKTERIKAQRELAKTFDGLRQSGLDRLMDVKKVGLISGLRTLVKIVTSHATQVPAEIAARVPASIADIARSAITGTDRTVAGPSVDMLRNSAYKVVQRALPDVWEKIRTGYTSDQGDIYSRIAGSSNPLELNRFSSGSKLLNLWVNKIRDIHGAAYTPFRMAGADMGLTEQAQLTAKSEVRTALKKGEIKPADAKTYEAQRAKFWYENPTPIMELNAIEVGEMMAFTKENKVAGAVNQVKNLGGSGKGGALWRFAVNSIVPFAKVPANVAQVIAKGNPLGAAYYIGKQAIQSGMGMAGKYTPEQMDANFRSNAMNFGRATVGSGIFALGYAAAASGHATGVLQDEQKKGAIQIGGRWFRIGLLPPFGTLFSMGATTYELIHGLHKTDKEGENKEFGKAALGAAFDLAKEQPLIGVGEGISQLFDKDQNVGRHAKRFVGGQIGSFVPTLLSDTGAQFDPFERHKDQNRPGYILGPARDIADYVQDRIPIVRNYLFAQRDYSGQPIDSTNKLFDPFNSRSITDPVMNRTLKERTAPFHEYNYYPLSKMDQYMKSNPTDSGLQPAPRVAPLSMPEKAGPVPLMRPPKPALPPKP